MATAYFNEAGSLICLIDGECQAPEDAAHSANVADGTNPNDIYFDAAEMTVNLKAELPISVAFNHVGNIPSGATIMFGDNHITVDDGTLEFDADVFETVLIYVDHPRHKAAYFEVPTGPLEGE
ncbi:hypothetical protein N6H05_19555 [Sphingobium sp. WTD-1]|uniref:hypothetical protein n=1 Tax=Sphingobium sp. WTD-1 TaxID=2979467 RepID=UPI0024DE3C5E|nr:hypothetical protein [Sphingobium sp. WTD-1]WIA55207.1 hypothetical protein N6H05_19555 [Sphingobium sp. WTD-1]